MKNDPAVCRDALKKETKQGTYVRVQILFRELSTLCTAKATQRSFSSFPIPEQTLSNNNVAVGRN